MSAGRKKDRYNETWTKEELTDSLKRVDKKSSQRSGEKSRIRSSKDDSEHDRRKNEHGSEREKLQRKSRSRHEDDTVRYDDDRDAKKKHRSSRQQEDSNDRDDRRRNDRRYRERDERSHKQREKLNGDKSDRDHYRSKRHEDESYDEKYHQSEKTSSRHHERRDHHDNEKKSSKYSSRREHDNESHENSKRDKRRHHDGEVSSQEGRRTRDHHSKYDNDRHDRSRDDDSHNLEKRKSKYDREYRNDKEKSDGKKGRSSKHTDDDEYRRRRKEDKQRELDEDHDRDRRQKKKEKLKSDEKAYERRHRRDDERDVKEYDDEHRRRRRRDDRDRYDDKKERRRRDDEEKHEKEKVDKDGGKNTRQSKHHTSKFEEQVESRELDRKSKSGTRKNDDEYDYEDEEFEVYEDDFEEDGDAESDRNENNYKRKPLDEMDELVLALKSENDRANSAQSSSRYKNDPTSDDTETPFSQSSYYSPNQSRINSGNSGTGALTMINFSIGSKSNNSKTRRKMLKRITDLSNLIQLESVGFDILDMPPVNEYNLYIKNFGNSNTTQVSVQCNDDNLDQDIQTDIPDMETKWTQHPPQDLKCSGGEGNIANNQTENDRQTIFSTLRVDTLRVTKFIKRASKLVEAVLNEDDMWRLSRNDIKPKSELSFCDSMTSLQTDLAYLQGRSIVHIASSQGSSHNIIAVAFQPAAHNFSTRIDRKGLIAVWDTRKPAIPEKILVCDACPTYCCFGMGKSYILFTGTDDGCVLAYDLREPGIHHQIVSLEKTRETVLRSATYSTGYLEDGHTSPIVSLMAVGAESSINDDSQLVPQTVDRKSHSGLAFQLASLEEAARLCIWIVVEMLPDVDSSDDLGLAPYGRIKLIRSLSYTVLSPMKGIFPNSQFQTTCVQFSHIDPNNFYVGTDTGHIIHCTQYSASNEQGNATNKDLLFNELDSISSVSTIDINPFQLFGASLILAGHDDGCIRLYLSDRKFPVISWPFSTMGAGIKKVQWSPIRPSVFFVLDSDYCLHVWDLAIMHAGPIKTELSDSKHMKNFSLSKASITKAPEIALIFDDPSKEKSILEVHKLAPHFSQVTDYQELDQLTFLIQSLL